MKRMKILLLSVLGGMLMMFGGQTLAVDISLMPSINKIHSGETLFVGIEISGLHSGRTDSLLGGWTMDVNYDPNILHPLAWASYGNTLGGIAQGEAMGFPAPDYSVTGVVTLGELSLLPIDSFFDFISNAWIRGLSCVQSNAICDPENGNNGGTPLDSFILVRLAFQLNSNFYASGQYTDISTANIVLADGNGNPIALASNPSISVEVPEPGTLPVFGLGVFMIMVFAPMTIRPYKTASF